MRWTLARILLLASLTAAVPATAGATDPAARFDAPGQHHADVCAPLSVGAAPLRFGDGSPTGFTLTTQQLDYDLGSCPSGTATLDLHELIPSAAGPLAFHRGGSGYLDRGNVKYGALAVGDLAPPLPVPVPSSGGRGAPCTLANEPPYQVDVRSITSRMHYKPGGGASYVPYGDPAADQGENDQSIHYSYLLWSWIDVAGGGTVRALLAPAQVVRACDVASITTPSYASDGQVNGQVTARYVRTLAGSCPIHGWMVWSHTYFGNRAGAIAHASALSTPPPPDPAPDPACPVAEPASPPIVATSSARAASNGIALTGLVNPKGVPTTYAFQFGTSPSYGSATPVESLGATDQNLTVALPASGLRPGAVYHYRLVAANTHGLRVGADRKLVPPNLTGLRAGSGKHALIRFKLSSKATVTLQLLRTVRGVHRVQRSLTRKLKAGRRTLPFAQLVGRRHLPRGRYVLTAVPRSANGLLGLVRTRRLRIR